MQICHCEFPEGILYDLDNFVWLKRSDDDHYVVTLGLTPILISLAGKLTKIKLKEVGTIIEASKSVGSIESLRYFGMVRCPVKGKIIEVNNTLTDNPKTVNDFPYNEGWFVKIKIQNSDSTIDSELNSDCLKFIDECHNEIKKIMEKLHVRCFTAFPDYEMFEIGVECAATLTKLDELIGKINMGNVVHVVSDDTSADLEMIRWSEERGQDLLESRKEGKLFHFIVKKIK
ncbi:MAG TPA: glycine cleavage system protein H [Nitrososphaeraceae archaeon]|nr:glycine cleavage system protein H [Nitrososphaeraceae archaeon]